MAAGLPWHLRLPGQPCRQAQTTGASEVRGALRCQPIQEEQPPKSGLCDSEPCFLAPNLPSEPLPPSSFPQEEGVGKWGDRRSLTPGCKTKLMEKLRQQHSDFS